MSEIEARIEDVQHLIGRLSRYEARIRAVGVLDETWSITSGIPGTGLLFSDTQSDRRLGVDQGLARPAPGLVTDALVIGESDRQVPGRTVGCSEPHALGAVQVHGQAEVRVRG
ncbi:hypothetical protein GCM10010236_78110 [Streptomyces eurythermus]|nr:hypothetical protein GCM10010236_78110 [Streptomyces eurythermus]